MFTVYYKISMSSTDKNNMNTTNKGWTEVKHRNEKSTLRGPVAEPSGKRGFSKPAPTPESIAYGVALRMAEASFIQEARPDKMDMSEIETSMRYIVNWSGVVQYVPLKDFPEVQIGTEKKTFSRLKFAENHSVLGKIRRMYQEMFPGSWVQCRVRNYTDSGTQIPHLVVRMGVIN